MFDCFEVIVKKRMIQIVPLFSKQLINEIENDEYDCFCQIVNSCFFLNEKSIRDSVNIVINHIQML